MNLRPKCILYGDMDALGSGSKRGNHEDTRVSVQARASVLAREFFFTKVATFPNEFR